MFIGMKTVMLTWKIQVSVTLLITDAFVNLIFLQFMTQSI